jgi:hypothetical protein
MSAISVSQSAFFPPRATAEEIQAAKTFLKSEGVVKYAASEWWEWSKVATVIYCLVGIGLYHFLFDAMYTQMQNFYSFSERLQTHREGLHNALAGRLTDLAADKSLSPAIKKALMPAALELVDEEIRRRDIESTVRYNGSDRTTICQRVKQRTLVEACYQAAIRQNGLYSQKPRWHENAQRYWAGVQHLFPEIIECGNIQEAIPLHTNGLRFGPNASRCVQGVQDALLTQLYDS